VTVAIRSLKEIDTYPKGSPRGLPSAATDLYRPITIGNGTDPATFGFEKSVGISYPSPGQTQVHLSRGGAASSERSQRGVPDEHTGHPQDPHAYRSKLPLVHPNTSYPMSSKDIAASSW